MYTTSVFREKSQKPQRCIKEGRRGRGMEYKIEGNDGIERSRANAAGQNKT
jgi:hypothetical protein